mmetsp:Transcript_18299/g.39858  ORF Transcript_18299/g.39858 Transcript_18299/m.39858 type:complete len:87 (+) Transcript_18299:2094-2354(+)
MRSSPKFTVVIWKLFLGAENPRTTEVAQVLVTGPMMRLQLQKNLSTKEEWVLRMMLQRYKFFSLFHTRGMIEPKKSLSVYEKVIQQ